MVHGGARSFYGGSMAGRTELVGESSRSGYRAPNGTRFDPTRSGERGEPVFSNLVRQRAIERMHDMGAAQLDDGGIAGVLR
jgi:hypothetical protein